MRWVILRRRHFSGENRERVAMIALCLICLFLVDILLNRVSFALFIVYRRFTRVAQGNSKVSLCAMAIMYAIFG